MIRLTSLRLVVVVGRALLVCLFIAPALVRAQILPELSLSITGSSSPLGSMAVSRQYELPGHLALPEAFDPSMLKPWKSGIVATVFWVGEKPSKNNPTPNYASSWDPHWSANFGGYDDPAPEKRSAKYFGPTNFVPKQNPFYVALPYNDCLTYKATKPDASKVVPWFKDVFQREGQSVCQNRWIAIRYQSHTCYAQWSDCGPFLTDDADYVFGDAQPRNPNNDGAGLDMSPAVRDYLSFHSGKRVDWRFVEASEVPEGPWKSFGITGAFPPPQSDRPAPAPQVTLVSYHTSSSSSTGSKAHANTHNLSKADRIKALRQQRDAWLSK